MYIHDFIGNISSSNAFRSDSKVELEFRPRFPICGGWKTDWDQGYNMPTKYHLKQSASGNQFELSLPFFHSYDILLAENYTVEVTLPLGATDIKVSIPFLIL